MNPSEATYTIKAGTTVHIHGIPVKVLADVPAFTNEGNVGVIEALLGRAPVPPPATSLDA